VITARVAAAIGSLRRAPARSAIARALATSLAHDDFRIVRLAIVARRIELIVEADDRIALARGMQGFQVAAARYLNASADRRGTVFLDRYRARPLATRRDLRAALAGPALRTAPLL
jgi:hypothetical protein